MLERPAVARLVVNLSGVSLIAEVGLDLDTLAPVLSSEEQAVPLVSMAA